MNDNDCHIWICILECDVYTILLLQVVTEKSDFSNLQVVTEKGLKVFTFKQLHSATGAFSKSNVDLDLFTEEWSTMEGRLRLN
jgi:hypothetical protein